MTSLVDPLPIVQLSTDIALPPLLSINDVTIDDNNKSIDQLSDPYRLSHLIYGNGRKAVLAQKYSYDTSDTRRNDYIIFSAYSSTFW